MKAIHDSALPLPCLAVHVVEPGREPRAGSAGCELDRDIQFSTEDLESYFFAEWEPVVYDALLVAGAVEFADRSCRRSDVSWRRSLCLRIPVHDPSLWNRGDVSIALNEALSFLTGDDWEFSFYKRRRSLNLPRQGRFELATGTSHVIPFSDGLDSRAVAGLVSKELGDSLVRVRLGTKQFEKRAVARRKPFAAVPYKVTPSSLDFVESSARSRGFKFALISGLAAYLARAKTVVVPESGQGSLGPALVTVGQAYPDYRSHPLFTARMEKFLFSLLGKDIRFDFPRIWNTKAETVRKFVDESSDGHSWLSTWSCWQQNRQVSVDGKKRHCGICAACMLRRQSIHAAKLTEPPEFYVWEDIGAPNFQAGAAKHFPQKKITRRLYEYAVAGVLHLDHLAHIRTSESNNATLDLTCFQLGHKLNLSKEDARSKMDRLLRVHEQEWKAFLGSTGRESYVSNWATA